MSLPSSTLFEILQNQINNNLVVSGDITSSYFPNQENLNPKEIRETQPVKRDEPKMGRNELVSITNGQETKEVKYKKALALIESGEWRII